MNAFILSVSRQGVIFAVVIFILSKTVGYYGVLSAQPVADFITAVVAIVLVRTSVYKDSGITKDISYTPVGVG